jgi:CRISPR type IV-associated protein Csf3
MTALTVTARLQQGIVLDTLFGTALDGLLASTIRDRAKAERTHATGTLTTGSLLDGGLHEDTPAVVDLPLDRCGTGPDWHWMCTTAYPTNPDGSLMSGDLDVHHHHSRIRERVVENTATRIPASIPPASGRYRMRRMPVVSTPATTVTWRAVGDPDAIADLLTAIPAIGRRRGTGEGTVLEWAITPDPTLDPFEAGHCHPNRTLGRPSPLHCVQHLGLPTDREGVAGLRPPYWHFATQSRVVLPEPIRGAS